MAHGKSYIPKKSSDYDDYFRNIVEYTEEKTSGDDPEWNHIPLLTRQELRTTYDGWHAAYIKTTVPHSPVETAEKNRLHKSSEKFLRGFVNQFLRYPPVTSDDRGRMGIPEHDSVRTPIGVPQTRPEFSILIKDIRRLSLSFRDQGSQSRGKPYGIGGAVVCWEVRDTPPPRPEVLPNSILATYSPYTLTFHEDERGKTVYIAMWWQSESGLQGPWSEVQSAIIP
jgi:hypothetical protein